MNKVYCPLCNEHVEYDLKKNVIKEHKGYVVNVEEDIPICKTCNNQIYIPEIEENNFKKLYEKYREVANLIRPEEIISLRDNYKISQRELVELLGWGKMTINRYERGALPSQSHNDILKLLISNEDFLIEKTKDAYAEKRISEKTYNKIIKSIDSMENNKRRSILINALSFKESEFNGFRKFDLDKLLNLVSYISDKTTLYKTSLNKYLWYIDFENFKRNVRSITGLTYIRYTYGPIIIDKKYEELIGLPNDQFYKEETEDDRNTITQIISTGKYDLSFFKEDELEVINDVISTFKGMRVTQISDLSHRERAWIELPDCEMISYDYAEDLKVEFNK